MENVGKGPRAMVMDNLLFLNLAAILNKTYFRFRYLQLKFIGNVLKFAMCCKLFAAPIMYVQYYIDLE